MLIRAPQPSQVLGDRYRLVRPLGSGGFGSVWYAEHLALHSPVALKILDPVTLGDEDSVQRFLREARAAAALRSPHVVQILDYGADSGVRYIVMEVLEGESLEERILRDKQLGVSDTERIVRHVGRAISRAHEAGIVHRDLKPGNIFIIPNDGDDIVKVLDFGVAKATNVALGRSLIIGATPAGALLGTPHYMSPEQAQGMRNLDFRTDFWSVGVIAYECLLGELPFPGENLAEVIAAICSKPLPIPSAQGMVPAGFDGWFARACARAPSERFESAKQMAAELTRICGTSRARTAMSAGSLARAAPDVAPRATPTDARRELACVPEAAPAASSPSSPSTAQPSSHSKHRETRARGRGWPGTRRMYAFTSVAAGIGAIVTWHACAGESAADTPAQTVLPLAASEPKAPTESADAPSVPAPIRIAPIEPASLELVETDDLVDTAISSGLAGATAPARSAAPHGANPQDRRRSPIQQPVERALRLSRDSSAGDTSSTIRATTNDCEPPWHLDEQGIRRVKPRCL
jgi:serine/threonine-protein kinase